MFLIRVSRVLAHLLLRNYKEGKFLKSNFFGLGCRLGAPPPLRLQIDERGL